jgi:3-hydroxybutyryl-CoA dehydrogenase
MSKQKIAVIGGGFMGSGIAQLAATANHPVTLIDRTEDDLSGALDRIAWSLKKLHAKEMITPSPESILARIETATELSAAGDADVVFEAVPEIVSVKQDVFRELDQCCKSSACIASNTSTIPIHILAEATNRPDRIVGTHFFFPVPLNPLLELIPSPQTGAETLTLLRTVCEEFGKYIVHVKKDVPGFIMNRVFGAMTCEAIRLVERGVANVEDVDRGLTTGYGMIQGPLAKADMAGLDVSLLAFSHVYELEGSEALKPPELLVQLVKDGHLGIKSGQGFYHYDAHGRPTGPAM